MAQHSPSDVVRQASMWSILWGILLIVFGMLAVGSPFLTTVRLRVPGIMVIDSSPGI